MREGPSDPTTGSIPELRPHYSRMQFNARLFALVILLDVGAHALSPPFLDIFSTNTDLAPCSSVVELLRVNRICEVVNKQAPPLTSSIDRD